MIPFVSKSMVQLSSPMWKETVGALLDCAGAAPSVVGYHLEHACLLRQELGLRDAALARRAGRVLRVAAEETLSRTDAPATAPRTATGRRRGR